MKKQDQAALIGAALAGAGLFGPDKGADTQERVPRKIFLARRYYKEHYQDEGEGRVFPVLKRPKKRKQ